MDFINFNKNKINEWSVVTNKNYKKLVSCL